jgi:hypothetical protein
MAESSEPRNPFYFLLLIVGLVLIVTVLAYAVMPMIEQKARDAGQEVPPRAESWFRNTLHQDGWKIVLGEVALLVVLGLASMGLDRWRRYKVESENSRATEVETPPPG